MAGHHYCAGLCYEYRWTLLGRPLGFTPAWLDRRVKGRLFDRLRRARLIGLIGVDDQCIEGD